MGRIILRFLLIFPYIIFLDYGIEQVSPTGLEAFKLMAHEIILDHLASPLKKITADLN
jgi:hypothetical protein